MPHYTFLGADDDTFKWL